MSPDDRPRPNRDPGSSGGWSLKTNVLYAVGGMGIFHACQFGVIILLAKFAPPDVLGQVRYALAIATPVVAFCSFELRGAFVADTAGEFTFGVYRRLRSVMMTLAGAVLLGMAIHESLSGQSVAYAVIFAGMCASKIVLYLAEIGWGLFQKRERLNLMAGSAALRGIAMLVAFALLVPLYYYLNRSGRVTAERVPDGAALAITLYVLASAAILLAFDRPRVAARPDHNPRWTWPAVRRLARQTFPLGLVLLILHLCNSIPELVIVRQVGGKTALGHFGALAWVTLAGNLVVFQAANAAANRVSRSFQTDFSGFVRLAGKLLGLAVAVAAPFLAVALLCGRWLLEILYRSDYAGYYDEFRIIVIAQCLALLTNVFGVLTTQMRLFWLQVPAQVIVLLSTIVAALVFIPQAEDPVRGGAWTLLVRSAVHVTLYAGCVLTGIILRPRLLQKRIGLVEEPARPAPPPTDTAQDW